MPFDRPVVVGGDGSPPEKEISPLELNKARPVAIKIGTAGIFRTACSAKILPMYRGG
jgi:hypothetical protein